MEEVAGDLFPPMDAVFFLLRDSETGHYTDVIE
jgi:hypothetical protein